MEKIIKVGIVGCGAIGNSLASSIAKEFKGAMKLAALYDIDKNKSKLLSSKVSRDYSLVTLTLEKLISKSDLVIECASSKSSFNIAKSALVKGRDIMIMSAGGIVGYLRQLSLLAKKKNAKVYIPSGAISGIDAVKAANLGKIRKVTLTTTKNPKSFQGVEYVEKQGVNLSNLKEDVVVFFGPANKAVRYFPQNINVSSVLAMAGIGASKTIVKIIASPKVSKNIHKIEVYSESANITTQTENVLHPDNPKTSYLAVLSALSMLRQILSSVRIGS